jgi:hypothetical protein
MSTASSIAPLVQIVQLTGVSFRGSGISQFIQVLLSNEKQHFSQSLKIGQISGL